MHCNEKGQPTLSAAASKMGLEGETPMNAEQRRALEKELQDILKITDPLVPATLGPNSPTAMSVPEVESEELARLRKRRDEIQQVLDEDSSEEDMRARVL
jgi:hypothetical protein